ncbi:prenylated Rab acceptor 1 [Zygosaccharomyces mellis]|uniref:PRA1 family protein n=1 Tax=Zygosaccharomyces mellis TaxID=42258 RepID=A0A4C2E4U5_9SACH|nr:prenylated Rab acceptor 1 [Zygosaccharomyces mellis]
MNQLGALSQFSRFTENLSPERIRGEFQNLQSKLSTVRPPQEFFNVKNFSKPQNFAELQSRASYNVKYYQSNYAIIVGALSIYSLLTNLTLLFVISLVIFGVAGISRLHGEDWVTPVGTFKVTQLYTALTCVAVPLGILASPFTTILWLVGASAVTVVGHAAFMEKPIQVVFEEETV